MKGLRPKYFGYCSETHKESRLVWKLLIFVVQSRDPSSGTQLSDISGSVFSMAHRRLMNEGDVNLLNPTNRSLSMIAGLSLYKEAAMDAGFYFRGRLPVSSQRESSVTCLTHCFSEEVHLSQVSLSLSSRKPACARPPPVTNTIVGEKGEFHLLQIMILGSISSM